MKKIIALFLVLMTVVSLFAGCGGSSDEIVLPKLTAEETLENRQAAIVAAAKAYYYKNPYVQYDNQSMTHAGQSHGLRAQYDQENAPEYASADLTVYDVCSAYVYDAVFQALGYKLGGGRGNVATRNLSAGTNVPEDILMFTHVNEGNDEATNLAAMEKLRSMLQPGDVVTYFRPKSVDTGHTLFYCGDLNGDGKGDILHCDGHKYDYSTGLDEIEENGAIKLNNKGADSADGFLFTKSFSQYLLKMDRYSLIRPALASSEEYPITQSVMSRMAYPDMSIFHTAECGNYGSVNVDGELTYTLTVKNNGTQDYAGVLVQIPVPQNAEIVKVNGAAAKNKTIKLNVDLPAGQEIAITYTVKPTAGVGSRIVAEGGYVHTIPLNKIITGVQKTSYAAEDVAAAIKAAEGKSGAEFVNSVWQTLSAEAPQIPEYETFRSTMFDRKSVGENKVFMLKKEEGADEAFLTLRKMWVEEYYGGMALSTMGHNRRVLECRYQDLQAGDVVIYAPSAMMEATYGVFDGNALVIAENGKNQSLLDFQFGKLLSYDLFVVLRPAQAN